MSNHYLLDTNAAIARIRKDADLETLLRTAEQIYVPVIVLGELYYGAENSRRVEENIKAVEMFVVNTVVLNCDAETAREFGKIAHMLRLKGRPIPENDIWIAALAQQHSLTLVTRDMHFDDIHGLSLERW